MRFFALQVSPEHPDSVFLFFLLFFLKVVVAGIFHQRFLRFLQNFSKFENRRCFVRQKHCDWITLKCVGFGKHTDRSTLNLLVSEGNSAGLPVTVTQPVQFQLEPCFVPVQE